MFSKQDVSRPVLQPSYPPVLFAVGSVPEQVSRKIDITDINT